MTVSADVRPLHTRGGRPPSCARAVARSIALLAPVLALPAIAQTEVSGFGSNPGNLRMFRYVPPGLPPNAPLVVALHGCAQDASSYDAESGWQLLAERWQFALLLPQQASANNASRCFNWFEAGDLQRDQGEPASIRQMIERMRVDHASDASRTFVTGLSAGGAMTAALLAVYPEVFAGGAIIAGVPYRCGIGSSAAFACMSPGVDLSAAQWADKVRAASSHAGPWPRVSIWHGDADFAVAPMNALESMQQWTALHSIDAVADAQDSVAGYPHTVYKDSAGVAQVETYLITGMGHGIPVDPGTGASQCGSTAAFMLDANVCSSYYIGRFWGLDNIDHVAPSVSLQAPADGSTVSGSVALAADAHDDVGIDRVEFLLDGALLASDDSLPYAVSWNSTIAANGSHSLQARAFDLADNVATSALRSVIVSNGGSGGTPQTMEFSNEDGNDGYVKANADGSSAVVGVFEPLYGLAIGRGVDGKLNRSLLSFDTAALPDGARIVSASLRVAYRSAAGDPWSNPPGNVLAIDVQAGCFGACPIEASDYAAAPSVSNAAQLLAFTGASQTSTAFNAAGVAAINRSGRTQLKLRFDQPPTGNHYLWVDHGARAVLRIQYLP